MILHRHHKIPKHAGGDNSPENIVLLTIEEHAEAHRILYEKYGRWQDRIAWLSLSKQINCAEATTLASIYVNSGRVVSPETRLKISLSRKGKKLPPHVIKNISLGHVGILHTPETKAKIGAAHRGRKIPRHRVEKQLVARQSTDGHRFELNGVEYPSHSAAAHILKDQWGISLEAARARVRRFTGHSGRNRNKIKMTKRADGKFERRPRDTYDTPPEAVVPLLPYLAPETEFAEPCAGNGFLIDALEKAGHRCVWATDIEPRRNGIGELNALTLPRLGKRNVRARIICTNPPWTRSILHPIIDQLSAVWPCFFLFDSDWAYTNQARDLLWRCARIVPVGRVKWIPGSKHVGFDNSSWYEFLPGHTAGPQFIPPGAPMMGPEERRRAEIVARGEVADPGPLFDPRVYAANGISTVWPQASQMLASIAPEPRVEAPLRPATPVPPSPKTARAAPAVPPGPSAVSLLAKLRASAGRVGPIPKLTPEAMDE